MIKIKEILGDTFILYLIDDGELTCSYEIFQNILSISLFRKAIVYRKTSVLFLNEIIHFFQTLSLYSVEYPVCYICDTQSLTLYCLRLLEKQGIVSIVGVEESEFDDLALAYYSLGSTPMREHWKMYKIKFFKNRSLTIDDVHCIRKIMSILKVDEEDLCLENQDGLLKSSISKKLKMKIDLFHLRSQLKIYQCCFRQCDENSNEKGLNLERKWKK